MRQSHHSHESRNAPAANDTRSEIALAVLQSYPEEESSDREKAKEQINIKKFSANELNSLKERDPFMYYSIPAVRRDTLLFKDTVAIRTKGSGDDLSPQLVKRQSRISFECHTDLIMEEIMQALKDEREVGNIDSDDSLEYFLE